MSGFTVMLIFCGSCGIMQTKSSNLAVKIIKGISPMTYTLELLICRVMDGISAKGFVRGLWYLNKGETYCMFFLFFEGLFFLLSGWLILWYKNSKGR